MKRCPACGQQFSEDYSFCLNDGTPLGPADNSQSFTDESPTVVNEPLIQPPKRGVPFYIWLFPLAGLLVSALVVGGYLIVSRFAGADNRAVAVNSSGGSNKNASPAPTVNTRSTPETTPSPTAISPLPTRSPTFKSYPETTRLKFARGAVSTTFVGDLDPNSSRSLVLACRSGQTLSASVSSDDNCVTFSGSTSFRATTNAGDNFLTLTNNCTTVQRFSIDITVL